LPLFILICSARLQASPPQKDQPVSSFSSLRFLCVLCVIIFFSARGNFYTQSRRTVLEIGT
jgi:hypothetical protein